MKSLGALASKDTKERKVLIHETKYALLGGVLLVIFMVTYTDKLIASIFPLARGPMIYMYKLLLFVALYYIIQKTEWFQKF
ncbi:MAG: hypothetical protein ACMG6E_00980 [Candidatus Roizmanbacteria bacterium]